IAADSTAPTVSSTTPTSGAGNAPVDQPIEADFSEAMDPATISAGTVKLRVAGGADVLATVTYDPSQGRALLTPASFLQYSTTYTATVVGGPTAPRATDLAGNPLAANDVWSFTTRAPPPPGTNPKPGLVAAYGFDEGSGATANDSSGTGNNGAITGATWRA